MKGLIEESGYIVVAVFIYFFGFISGLVIVAASMGVY